MKKLLFSILLSVMFLGICIRGVMAQSPPALDVSLTMDERPYLLNPPEPVMITIALDNAGADDIITSEGFSGEDFRLLLTFIDPDGNGIIANDSGSGGTGGDPPPPPVIPVEVGGVIQLLQMEPVEGLPAGWQTEVTFNSHDDYALTEAGDYSVTAIISIRTYLDIDKTVDGVDYAELEPVLFQGVIESDTVNFSLRGDTDGDGYFSDVDCDDNDPAVNPGATEIVGNDKDDDCDPETLDVVTVTPGTIEVVAEEQTGSTKVPIVGMAVRAYDRTNECVSYFGGVKPKHWQKQYGSSIWGSSCDPTAEGVTGADGKVSLDVPPAKYIVIGEYDPDIAVTDDEIYLGKKMIYIVNSEQSKSARLKVRIKANGDIENDSDSE